MKTYIVKLGLLMTWGHGDLEHPQAQYFLAKTMCAFALMYIYHLKVKITLKVLFSKRKKKFTHCIAKNIYVCFFVIIVNWMIFFFYKGSIEYLGINSLSPGGCSFNFMCVMFKCVVVITFLSISNTMYCLYVNGSGSWQMSVRIGLGNGLVLSGNKAIAWTNVDRDLCCHMVSLDHNELISRYFKSCFFIIKKK